MTRLTLYVYAAVVVLLLGAVSTCTIYARSADRARARAADAGATVKLNDRAGALQAPVVQQRKKDDALNAEAHADPLASTPLPGSVLDRLRAGDRELCASGRVVC